MSCTQEYCDCPECLNRWRNNSPFRRQSVPVRNDSTPIVDLVLADLNQRSKVGLRKYGTLLQAGNGRDALWDAYEEALDLAMYLRQAIAERQTSTTTDHHGCSDERCRRCYGEP